MMTRPHKIDIPVYVYLSGLCGNLPDAPAPAPLGLSRENSVCWSFHISFSFFSGVGESWSSRYYEYEALDGWSGCLLTGFKGKSEQI